VGIPRKSRFAERIGKMRGLMPIEKDLLRRIGELSDGAINNRAPTNPGTQNRRILVRSSLLPPPVGLTVQVGPKSAKIEWHPVDSPVLQMYEAEVTNRDTNLTDVKFCFTNRLYVGGSGRYRVKVRSVSRDGHASPYGSTVLQFTLQDDLIFLEGTGVGPTKKTNIVIEDITTPVNYKVFAWGSLNLGNFNDAFQNSVPVMDLSINGWYPRWSRIVGFRETALFSNLDDAGLIGEDRTAHGGTRSGMLMTPISWMFKPFYVEAFPGLAGTTPKFYMIVTNPQDDTGETNLSLLSIPASITTIQEEEFISGTSIDLGVTGNSIRVINGPGGSAPTRGIDLSMGNSFTLAMWVKMPSWDVSFYSGLNPNNWGQVNFQWRMFDMAYYGLIAPSPKTLGEATRGKFILKLEPLTSPFFLYGEGKYPTFIEGYTGGSKHFITAELTGGALSGFGKFDTCLAKVNGAFKDGWSLDRQPNGVGDALFAHAGGKWIHLAVTYDSELEDIPQWTFASGTNIAQGIAKKIEIYWNGQKLDHMQLGPSSPAPVAGRGKFFDSLDGNVVPSGFGAGFTSDNIIVDSLISQIDMAATYITDYSNGKTKQKSFRMYHTAMWDGALSEEAIHQLAQNPSQDLRTSSGDYDGGESLLHWWVFGQNPAPLDQSEICTDLGGGYPISLTDPSFVTLATLKTRLKNDRPSGPAGTSAGVGSDSTPF